MAASYGAHEVMEVHEVLSSEITSINTAQLYRQHIKDVQLSQIADKQLQFMVQGYNTLVQAVQSNGMQSAVPYRSPKMATPTYGLHQPAPASPVMSVSAIDDRDVACALLDLHKAGATQKMRASLECADSNLRRILQQGAINCGEQAYEVWQYMNQHGYYQVPTMKEMTTQTMINTYQPVAGGFPSIHTAPYGTSEFHPSTYVSQTQQPSYSSHTTNSLGGATSDYSYGNYTSTAMQASPAAPFGSQASNAMAYSSLGSQVQPTKSK
ncbi:spore coat protein [Brevibacillus ginsengisoli]|uniref:spore coat protein n=1 Tax=Brevibacillus ginsengisoli TaxID=363854 RepID=UPI003CF8BDD2